MLCPAYGPSASSTMGMSRMDMAGMDMAGMDMAGMAHPVGQPSHGGGSQDHDGSSFCPFAAAATSMASGHASVYSAAIFSESESVQLPEQPVVPRGTIVPTRLPRGPPSLA